MRLRATFAALAAVLILPSCSDDPAGPGGAPVETNYQPTIDFFDSPVVSLWGQPSGDVYASGLSIMRFDGEAWSALVLPEDDSGYLTTWGTANGDVFALGRYAIHRYDGESWERMQRPASVRDTWASDNGELFMVGGNHRLYHYDGAQWFVDSLMTDFEQGDPWQGVSGADPDDVYIVGYSGWLGHYDGEQWTAQRIGVQDHYNCWKAPDGPLYVMSYDSLFTYDGAQLEYEDLGPSAAATAVGGHSATEVYCCVRGDDYPQHVMLRYDGNDWTQVCTIDGYVEDIWGDAATGRLFAAGSGVVWDVKDGKAEASLGARDLESQLLDAWGSEEGAIYVVGGKAYRYFEDTWTDLHKEDLTTNLAFSIWGRSEHEIYAVGPGIILHYDGSAWTAVSGGAQSDLYAVGGSEDDVFAVGRSGDILHLDGNAWTHMESGTTYDLYAVYAWKGGAFAVGEDGAVIRYDGREWRPFPTPVSWSIYDLIGFGPKDIYAVGDNSTEMCHFDGRAWTPIFIGYTGGLNESIWGTSGRDLFIGQGSGNVIHFDGHSWSFLPRVTTARVTSLWGTHNHEIVALTRGGVVHYRP
jgi:hypothetical protein